MPSIFVLAALLLFASGCVVEEDEPAPQRPDSSYEYAVDGFTEFGETFDTPSCVYSRQEANLGQYSIDARMVNQPDAANPAVIQLRFPDAVDEPPAAGDFAVPDDADLTMTMEAPYGSMLGTAGTVTVTELANFRKVEVEGTIEGFGESGELFATLYCPL